MKIKCLAVNIQRSNITFGSYGIFHKRNYGDLIFHFDLFRWKNEFSTRMQLNGEMSLCRANMSGKQDEICFKDKSFHLSNICSCSCKGCLDCCWTLSFFCKRCAKNDAIEIYPPNSNTISPNTIMGNEIGAWKRVDWRERVIRLFEKCFHSSFLSIIWFIGWCFR